MEGAAEKFKEQRKLNSLLVLACSRGYIGDVQELLDRGADLTAQDKKKISAIHFAAGHGRLEVVKFLRSKGAELDIEDSGGRTPVHMAVLGNHPEVLAFLLSKGAWCEGNDANDDTPLHLAARQGSLELVQVLLKGGGKATLNELNKRGLSALGEAVAQGHAQLAEFLIKQGADAQRRTRGWTLLHIAAGLGHAAVVKVLLSAKLDVNDQKNDEGITPLHAAAKCGSLPTVQALLKAKADKACVTADGKTSHDIAPKGQGWDVLCTLSRKAAPTAGLPAQPSRPQSATEKFTALSLDEQLKKVAHWARLETDQQLDTAIVGLDPAVREKLIEARRAHQFIAITKAVADLHEDEDFQRLAARPGVEETVNELRQNGEAVEKYRGNADMMEVLTKLRRFQMVIRANGRHTVPFEALLVNKEPDWKEKDVARLRGMNAKYESCLKAAIQAIIGEIVMADSEGSNVVPGEQGNPEIEGQLGDTGSPQPGLASGGNSELAKPFTWKDFGRELLNQAVRSAVMGLFFVIGLWLLGHQMPWQQAAPGKPDPEPQNVYVGTGEL